MTKVERFLQKELVASSYSLRKAFPGPKWARNIGRLRSQGRIASLCGEALFKSYPELWALARVTHPKASTFWVIPTKEE
jgi:hypothetical protein